MTLTPVRKIIAAAVTALVTATGFLTWLQGTGDFDGRGWLAIIVTAVSPPFVALIVPDDGLRSPWWPIRRIGAAAVTALTSSAAFLTWLAGTGVFTVREALALVASGAIPVLMGYLTPTGDPPNTGGPSIDETLTIA